MNRNRRKGSDSDTNSVVSSKSKARKKAVADVPQWPAESAPSPRKFGSTKASSIRSYRMDDDDERDVPRLDRYSSFRSVDSPRSRKSVPTGGYNALYSDINPYAALRIAGAPRASSDQRIRIADTHYNRQTFNTSGNDDHNTDPYVALKIAGSQLDDFGDEIIYDSNGSSGIEEDADVSDEDLAENSGSEEGDDEYTNNARVSVTGSENGQGKDGGYTAGYARVSVAGSDYGKNGGRGYARVSMAGSEPDQARDRDDEFQGYAKVSVPTSDIDYGNDANYTSSLAGSEAGHGRDSYPKVSVAGSDNYHHQDGYARLSVAGVAADSTTGVETDSTGYARIFVSGSEAEYQKDFDRDVSGTERVPVVEKEADHVAEGHLSDNQKQMPLSDAQRKEQESLENEYAAYLELSPEIQAKLQYRVLVVLISPRLQLKKRTLAAFFDLYSCKFGVDPGFSSVASLCRAMPGVIQSKQSENNDEELIIVDSNKNRRAVSGIRSGLRRIVYDVLKPADEGLTCSEFEEKCSELLGKPLGEVLEEHEYDIPTVESLVKDVPDIACLKEAGLELRVYLCPGAEDPSLTDGLLVRNVTVVTAAKPKGVISEDDTAAELKGVISEVEGACDDDAEGWQQGLVPMLDDKLSNLKNIGELVKPKLATGPWSFVKYAHCKKIALIEQKTESGQGESLTIGSSVTLRSLKNELRWPEGFSPTSISSLEEEFLQVRLRMRILLAFYNSGHGIDGTELQELYAKTFGQRFNLQELGFNSIMELARQWKDICLLQEPKPGWVFLVPSQANRRILNTLRTGLRSSVFSVLVETYPEGLDPWDFLHRLQEGMSGELWEVLDATGYVCSDAEKADSILSSSSSSDFQLVDFEEICVLLDDMMDFVRLGSNDDGSVVVKLKNGEVPLVDLLDCKLNETDMGSFDELFVNLMMIAVDDAETSGNDEDGSSGNDGFISVGHVKSLVKSFESNGSVRGLRSAHSQAADSLRLKHELRLILGCPEYYESGLALNELSNVYRDRTGEELGSKSKIKSLLRGMPDLVFKDSLVGDSVHLCKTPKNLRILSTTRAGLRQVLFWALVKNPGGVWANLLEGWFTDFAGVSLSAFLQMHGYETSKSKPFFPVYAFLRDMNDLLQKRSAPLEMYTWAGEVKDPVHSDASLLGLSELLIQYDPLRFKLEKVSKKAEVVEEISEKSALTEDGGCGELDSVNGAVLENNDNTKEALEEEPAMSTITKEDDNGRESKMDHRHRDNSSVEQERIEESGVVLSNGEIEGPVEQKGTVKSEEDSGESLDVSMDSEREQRLDVDGQHGPVSGENEETPEEDESHLSQIEGERVRTHAEGYAQLRVAASEEDDIHLPKIKGDQVRSNADAYAQLRVAGKGPKVNLDDWQFTDSEEDEEEEDEEEEDEEEEEEDEEEEEEEEEQEQEEQGEQEEDRERENSVTSNSIKVPGPAMPKVSSVGPEVKEEGKDARRAWIVPNKGVPWK